MAEVIYPFNRTQSFSLEDLQKLSSMTPQELLSYIRNLTPHTRHLVMQQEALRRQTFYSDEWNLDNGVLLAGNGLFFGSLGDRIRCNYCEFESSCSCFKDGRDVLRKHNKDFPRCPFLLRSPDCVNEMYEDNGLDSSDLKLVDSIFTKNTRDISQQENAKVPEYMRNRLGISKPNLYAPQYAIYCYRKHTFDISQNNVLKELEPELVAAGFFYSGNGTDDKVTCFDCGVTLSSWSISDNPSKIHANRKPDCLYLENLMGTEFISRSRAATPDSDKKIYTELPATPGSAITRQTVIGTLQKHGFDSTKVSATLDTMTHPIDCLDLASVTEIFGRQNDLERAAMCPVNGCHELGNRVALPCRHLVYCNSCYKRFGGTDIEVCGKCFKATEGYMKIYFG